MNKNPEDYYMQGTFMKNTVGEDLEFLDLVEMREDKKFYLLEDEDSQYFRGQMMESVKRDEMGNIMVHGFIVPRGEEEEYMRFIKRGAMLEILDAVGEAFEFEVHSWRKTPNVS